MNDDSAGRWPRDVWLDVMWDSPEVKPNERIVAYVYARYAGSGNLTWCPWDELRKRTGIKSRDAISRALSGLIEGSWLVEVERARQHRSARYRLTTPSQKSGKRTSKGSQTSGKQTSEPDPSQVDVSLSSPFPETSSPFPETSSPFNGPDLSNGLLQRTTQRLGGTLPPDPLRTDSPQAACRADSDPTPEQSKTSPTELDQESPVPSGRRHCASHPLLAAGNDADGNPLCPLCRRAKLREAS